MSLILEALKKSEARRQLGEAPGLGTPFTVARRRRRALPVLIVLIVVAAAFGAWYLRPRAPAALDANTVVATPPRPAAAPRATPRPAPPAATTPAAGMAVPAAPAPGPAGVIAPSGGGSATSASSAPPMTIIPSTGVMHPEPGRPVDEASARRPRAAARGEQRDSPFGARRAMPTAGVNLPATAQRPPSPAAAPAPAKPSAPGAFQSAAVPPAAAAAAAAARPTAAAPVPQPATTTSAAPAAPASAPAPAAATNLPLYYELPYDVRKDLPALVISMHVYASAPAQRFVVIDGERKAEGESLKDGLTLREIRSDGVVLEFRGQRFFYPRPGR